MFYDIPSSSIFLNGGGTTCPIEIFCPTSSYSYKSVFANLGVAGSQSCLGYNNEVFSAGANSYRIINRYSLTIAATGTQAVFGITGVNDMTEYLNAGVS